MSCHNRADVIRRKHRVTAPTSAPYRRRITSYNVCYTKLLRIRVINVYVPNGQQVGSDKYAFKLQWLERLAAYVADELRCYPALALIGDFNIAPEDRDVHDPTLWQDSVLFSEQERRGFRALLEVGLVDVFRKFEQLV